MGGFSKLMNYYNFENLVTYADLRYSNGNGYFNSGWKLIEQTYPNYWYWNKKDMHIDNRIKFQKHKLEIKLKKYNPELSEVENMYNNGFTRIWDCGNIKMKLEK